MVDTEVQNILSEIRERVRATHAAEAALTSSATEDVAIDRADESGDATTNALALIDSYLTTTGRAWDRLPPVVTNRSGLPARLELWLKRYLRRATRWYAWEQINFNAAVHHALRDLLPLISAQHHELERMRAGAAAAESKRAEYLTGQLAELRNEIDAQHHATDYLTNELRERDERLLEEQRVCFKQLSLETSEAAVIEDRARRKAIDLLEELQRRVERLEKN